MRTPKSNIEKSKVNRSNETSFKSKFSNQRKIILVLGMVNSNRKFNYNIKAKNYANKFGQAMRDQRRIAALSKHGYKIYSLDNKHDPIQDKQRIILIYLMGRARVKLLDASLAYVT